MTGSMQNYKEVLAMPRGSQVHSVIRTRNEQLENAEDWSAEKQLR